MSTLSQVADTVREIVDLDEEDLPLSLIQTYVKDGFQRIIELERRWGFYQTTYTLSTIADQREYTIDDIGDGEALREIVSVIDTSIAGNRLNLISHDEAEAIWVGSLDTPGRPYHYSIWGGQLHLYPKPDTVYPLKVRGYREPSYDWVTVDEEIDCDASLHIALIYYAVSREYQRQEDPELAAMYKQSFDEAVAIARQDLMKMPSARPLVMAGGSIYPSRKRWLEDLGRTLGQ
jgi:hypothetical protein